MDSAPSTAASLPHPPHQGKSLLPSPHPTPGASASALRNIKNVVLGDTLFQTWYPSFYPEELVGKTADRLYVCRWCFKYSKEAEPYVAHTKVCELKGDKLGRAVYQDGRRGLEVSEVDGEEKKVGYKQFRVARCESARESRG